MKNRTFIHWFLPIFFFLIISIPLFGYPRLLDEFSEPTHLPAQRFSIRQTIKAVLTFPQSFNEFFNQGYAFYPQHIEMFHQIRLNVFHEREYPNVIIGRQDWLFYTGENNIKDFECTSPFTRKELNALVDLLSAWDERLRSMGIDFYVMIAPNKETIYPQYLPPSITASWGVCRLDQVFLALAQTNLNTVDLRPALAEAARGKQVYHRTDTHWNDHGALVAVDELIALMQKDYPQITALSVGQYEAVRRPFSGDLGCFLPEDERFVEDAVFLSPKFDDQPIIVEGENRRVVARLPGSALPKALVFRDSFADALIPFLAQRFSSVVFVPAFAIDFELVEAEHPDVVIFEIAQRYLGVLH